MLERLFKFSSLFFSVLFLLGCASEPQSKLNKNTKPIKASAVYTPSNNASAYAVIDIKQKKFLEGKNFNLVRPIASVTKLMTALVFLEEQREGQCQTSILASDADFIKGTVSPLPKNVGITCSELLKAMLVRSDNEAAHALAHATPLTKAQFIAKMNAKAKALGMNQTHFKDSSGLSAENVSSVSDLAKLSAYVASKPEIQYLSNLPLVSVYAGGQYFSMKNTNRIVREQSYPALVSKTGFTREAGYNLVFVHKGLCNGKLIGVIGLNYANASERADFTEAMLAKYQCKRQYRG